MKAAVYSRFSTDRQNESSIADQVRVCAEYAGRQGWQVVEYFEDQGISGAALETGPVFSGFRTPHSPAVSMPFWLPIYRACHAHRATSRR